MSKNTNTYQFKQRRLICDIAKEIQNTWKNIPYYANPYLQAMLKINSNDPHARYLAEDAETVILYFLANASSFKGEDAKRLKAELKFIINSK